MKKKKDKTKHKYLVGFIGDNQVVYGKDKYCNQCESDIASYTKPLTLLQAKRQLKQLGGEKTIYELKPVSNLAVKIRIEMLARNNNG
jgi:hypothetical protein